MDIKLEQELIKKIANGEVLETKLETDDKVLARITDGIYRLPGSALRELISNAYDADAENVYIDTDVPRFDTITIRDDGNGMSIETLVNMLRHIGGSAKRTEKGKELQVTDAHDNSLSLVRKRKLIGKIGIGLFSVAQLTRDFEIVTKQKSTNYYLRAKVQLFNYSDESVTNETHSSDERGKSFQTGEVKVWKEETTNLEAHGTDIMLFNVKQSAKDQLRSLDIWGQIENETETEISSDYEELNSSKAILPDYHVGCLIDNDGVKEYDENYDSSPSLPWEEDDAADKKFIKLYEAILDKTKNAVSPKLNLILDNYLNMIWTLGLSIPLDYIEKHPFHLSVTDLPDVYTLSNKRKGQAEELVKDSTKTQSFGDVLGFTSQNLKLDFNVNVDGIKLFRPLKFTNLPESKALVKKPIIFLGKYKPNLSELDVKDSGGELEFEAYCLWTPKVSPKDHNGSLIRIHNASGILFDETFMKHQVAEHTIKSQLTIEIFVNKGLDSALNIDRESFNIAHPHYQIVMRWLHSAIRQVVNKYKSIKKELRSQSAAKEQDDFTKELDDIVSSTLVLNLKDPLERFNLVVVNESSQNSNSKGNSNESESYVVSQSSLNEVIPTNLQKSDKNQRVIKKSEAILQIMDAYGLLDNMKVSVQEQLVLDIVRILKVED